MEAGLKSGRKSIGIELNITKAHFEADLINFRSLRIGWESARNLRPLIIRSVFIPQQHASTVHRLAHVRFPVVILRR